MSQANPLQTAVRMFLRAIDEKDWSVVQALMHPTVVYEVSGFLPFQGADAVMNYYQHLRPIVKGDHFIESMIIDGDKVASWGRFNGSAADGKEISILFADIMEFEERKIVKRRVYYCEPSAMS